MFYGGKFVRKVCLKKIMHSHLKKLKDTTRRHVNFGQYLSIINDKKSKDMKSFSTLKIFLIIHHALSFI